jgi:hypothetical protein
MPLTQKDYVLWPGEPMPDPQFCTACRGKISMQIFMNTGVCCELCRKVDKGEISHEEWTERMEQADDDARKKNR